MLNNFLGGPHDPHALYRPANNSAPPSPAAAAVLHPPVYIHTHHPRRSSLTPLNLNTISPAPPSAQVADHVRRESHLSGLGVGGGTSPTLRRKSLTPSLSTLAVASPSKLNATGTIARRPLGSLSAATDPRGVRPGSPERSAQIAARRGRGSWTGSEDESTVVPSAGPQLNTSRLGPRRSSQPINHAAPADDASPFAFNQDFKFGAAPSSPPHSISAEAEAAEAERQRMAFMQATYGRKESSSRKLDAPGLYKPNGQEALMGSEGYRRGSLTWAHELGSDSEHDDRRPSVPIAIPAGSEGRHRRRDSDVESIDSDPEAAAAHGGDLDPRQSLTRPLPPLLPLSDPGPRLLPSTLALHRASHMLQARNLASEPLPAPLPPSLHPPAPVEVTDFDVDFIMSGNAADGPLASTAPSKNKPFAFQPGVEEDSFARFVGANDENYDARRSEWTFKATSNANVGLAAKTKAFLSGSECLQWGSAGAGDYLIRTSGEVHSLQTGRTWRVRRQKGREYELEDASDGSDGRIVVLASKGLHNELGGVKHDEPTRTARFDSDDSAMTAKVSNFLQALRKPEDNTDRPSMDMPRRKSNSLEKPAKSKSIGDKIKRSFLGGIRPSSFRDDKAARKESQQREKAQSRSWSGATSGPSLWSSSSSSSSPHDEYPPPWTAQGGSGVGDQTKSLPPGADSGALTWQEGRAWSIVPDEAVAMVIPLNRRRASTATITGRCCLLIYFVPFVSDEQSSRPSTSRTFSSGKSLRRQLSREKWSAAEPTTKEDATAANSSSPSFQYPLPFRSFRIVATVVEPEQLRSEPVLPHWSGSERDHNGGGAARMPRSHAAPLADRSVVIAVCHSRGSGVEFVLEGWDRLGLCRDSDPANQDERNYAEWQGNGLSEEGRAVMDVVWAACVGVMGLQGQ